MNSEILHFSSKTFINKSSEYPPRKKIHHKPTFYHYQNPISSVSTSNIYTKQQSQLQTLYPSIKITF